MRTFEDYILEQRLDELGNASAKPYPYKVKYKNEQLVPFVNNKTVTGILAVSKFKTEERDQYFIDHIGIHKHLIGKAVEIGFGVFQKPDVDKSAFDLTNAGLTEAFRVMSTVITCTREVLTYIYKKYDYAFDYIMFSPSMVGKGNGMKASQQRERLYKAFMKKQPALGKVFDKNGKTFAEIKPGFYK
jgi:hypothetical protein